MNSLKNTSSNKYIKVENDGHATVELGTANYIKIGDTRLYAFTTAITGNSTTTSAPAGSIAFTSHATGRNKFFYSDASKWQLLAAVAANVTDASALTSSAATGGDAPTEAEYNALRTDVSNLRTTVNALLASLRSAGAIA